MTWIRSHTCLNCDKPTSGRYYCSNLCEDTDRHPAPVDDLSMWRESIGWSGELDRMVAWPNGHLVILEGDGLPTKLGRCDCGGMSATNPSHRLGPITDSLRAGRIMAGRNPDTGRVE